MANGTPKIPRGSIFGALLLISLGSLFLYANINPSFGVWALIAQYWPVLIIFWGASKLVDYLMLRGTPEAASAARLRGGEIFGLILLLLCGTAISQAYRHGEQIFRFGDDGDFNIIFGETYEFPAELTQTIELPATLTIKGRGDVKVSTTTGKDIRIVARKIVPADSEEEARHIADRFEPVLEKITGGYELRWRQAGGSDRGLRYHLELFVPAQLNLKLDTRRGDVEVRSLRGNLTVDLSRGSLKVEDLGGNLEAKISRASVEVDNVNGNVLVGGSGTEVFIRTVSGSAGLKGEFYGPIQMREIKGEASFRSRRTEFTVSRLDGEMVIDSGDMVIRGVPGEVVLETRNKEIEMDDILGPVRVENRNGPVVIRYRRPPTKTIEVTNRRGSIELVLPGNSGFEIDASNRRGGIDSEFAGPDLVLRNSEDDRRTRVLTGKYGRPRATITLRTSSGEINLRKIE